MASIKHVARLSGVSVATVSNVINKTKYVSDELVQRVEEAINALDYRPDLFAKSLKTGKSGIIAVVLAEMESPICASLSAEIVHTAHLHNLAVLSFNSAGNPAQEVQVLDSDLVSYCSGMLVMPLSSRPQVLHKLKDNGPILTMELEQHADESVCSVCFPIREAITKTVRRLVQSGHSDIAFVANGDMNAKLWFESFCKALGEAGLPVKPDLIKTEGGSINGGFKAVNSLLVQSKRPTAILVTHDLMTLGAIKAFSQEGLRLTDGLVLAGLTSEQVAATHPGLLGLIVDTKAMAELAVEQLILQIRGENSAAQLEAPVYLTEL